MIWFKNYCLTDIENTIGEMDNVSHYLELCFMDMGPDYLTARLPVTPKSHQVHGILHGGVTCLLAETLGSVASLLVVDPATSYAVGSVISVNHLRPTSSGFVSATARPVHLGKTKHVWDIMVQNDDGKPTAKCELTCAVVEKQV